MLSVFRQLAERQNNSQLVYFFSSSGLNSRSRRRRLEPNCGFWLVEVDENAQLILQDTRGKCHGSSRAR